VGGCEVAAQLEEEVFLGEDNHDKLVQQSGKIIAVELEHPALFKSTLALFRRLWMQEEASYYDRIRNTLYRYTPPSMYDGLRPLFYDYYKKLRKSFIYPQFIPMSAEALIDLWLNTQFAHAGRTRKRGKFSRNDFDALAKNVEPDAIEFTVRMAIKLISGGPFLNLYRVVALPELKRYERAFGLRPSFQLKEPGSAPRYKKLALETPAQILARLLKRQRFSHIESLLTKIFDAAEEILPVLVQAESLTELTDLANASIVAGPIEDQRLKIHSEFVEPHSPWRSGGFEVFDPKLIVFKKKGFAILNDEFTELREAFFADQMEIKSWKGSETLVNHEPNS
jgi:hypothetical protein